MKEKSTLNAVVTATKEKGFVVLKLSVGDIDNLYIKVNDFGGKEKKRAQALTYKIYKYLGGK